MEKKITANLIWILVAGASYYLLAKLGMELFALKPGNITLLWLPSGIALVIYLQWGYRAFPLIFIASFAANFSGMSAASGAQAFLHTMIAAASDALTAMLAYRICQRYLPHGLVRPEDLLPFGLGVCLLPAFVSGLILALNLLSGGYIAWNELGSMIRMITLADNMGILLVYPLYQGWLSGMRLPATEQRWVIAAAMTITVLLLLSFAAMPGLLYFCLPVMSLLAFYAGFTGVAALGSLSVIVIIAATAQGLGPFLSVDAVESNFELMSFSYAYMVVVLGTALLMRDIAHRKATEAALLHSETKFKTLFESSAEAVMLLDSRGFFDCNRATLQMFGCASREEFCAKHPSDLAPPLQPDGTNSFEFASKKIMMALKSGCELFEYQHRRADSGHDFQAEVARLTEGQGVDVILDIEAGAYVAKEVQSLRDDGRLVIISVQGGVHSEFNAGLVLRRRLTVTGSTLRPRPVAFKAAIARACLTSVWPLLASGQIKPVIHSVFDAADAVSAHALMEANQHFGKIVFTWEKA